MTRARLMIDADTLRSLRLNAFLTQVDLSEKSGVSLQRIKQLETALGGYGVTPATAKKLARALRCKTAELCQVVEEVAS